MADTEDLLDIEQAARFLKVSETSLRRWTNSGRLACLRVGRRRERRFRRADLLAFMEDQPVKSVAGHGRSRAPEPGHTVIEGVNYAFGTHLCGLYDSDLGGIKQAVAFLRDGFRPGSVCFYAASEKARDDVLAQLKQSRPSVQKDIAAGRLVLSDYIPSPSGQLEYWESHLRAAVRAGAHSFRVVGDLCGLGPKVSVEGLFEYESGYEEAIAKRFPLVTLCQYDVRQFSSVTVLSALKLHRDTFRYPAERLLA